MQYSTGECCHGDSSGNNNLFHVVVMEMTSLSLPLAELHVIHVVHIKN